ncbi:hypothetical protein HAZT_HAZT011367 [Hyalella azteca]|uniref:Uncharacterized protein n=1 Tax=Hyalella azteca TaxID=294128 RepID=A0A6A0H784_HYAAZ|nr:hypothetical protein HAZT_HAZT011367 [Hyalella azteca]
MDFTSVAGGLGPAQNLVSNNSSADDDVHCGRDALTNSYGWFVQLLLATLAFMLLIVKRFCEPLKRRRSWLVWFYDTSKQGLGAALVHFSNVILAEEFTGDPCTCFLLDSTVGLMLVWAGIRLSIFIGRRYRLPTLIFGDYGRPPSHVSWMHQCLLYCGLMGVEKLLVTALMRLPYWTSVRDIILAPITSPQLRVVVVVLIIPFFINALIFWVTDNFLMLKVKPGALDLPVTRSKPGDLASCVDQVFYQRCGSSSASSGEGDVLISNAEPCDAADLQRPPLAGDWHDSGQVTLGGADRCLASDSADVTMLGVHEDLSASPFTSPVHQANISAVDKSLGLLSPLSVGFSSPIAKLRHLSVSGSDSNAASALELNEVINSPARLSGQQELLPDDVVLPHTLNEAVVTTNKGKPGKKMV